MDERKGKLEAIKVLAELKQNYDHLQKKFAAAETTIDKLRFEGNDGVSVTPSEQNEISVENHKGSHTNSLSSLHYKLTEIKDQLYGLEILCSDVSSFSSLGTIHIFRKHFYSTKLNLTSKCFTKTGFIPCIRQNKRKIISALHFDKIFML